jgi:hypothetical protein
MAPVVALLALTLMTVGSRRAIALLRARQPQRARSTVRGTVLAVLALFAVGLSASVVTQAGAQTRAIVAGVDLATASNYSVLGGSRVTNTGDSVLAQSLGLSPGTSVTGFPPGQVVAPGTIGIDAAAAQAQLDLTLAYVDAANRPVDATTTADLVDLVLQPGVYAGPDKSPLSLTGPLVLDAGGDSSAVWIFQTDSTLITASGSTVSLINGAQACNVFWQVGSSATLGTGSSFVGNLMALTAITVTQGVTVSGRVLARNDAVTLDDDTFTVPSCETGPPATTSTVPGSTTTETPGSTTTTETPGSTTSTEVPASTTSTEVPASTTTTETPGSTTTTETPGSTTTTETPASTTTTETPASTTTTETPGSTTTTETPASTTTTEIPASTTTTETPGSTTTTELPASTTTTEILGSTTTTELPASTTTTEAPASTTTTQTSVVATTVTSTTQPGTVTTTGSGGTPTGTLARTGGPGGGWWAFGAATVVAGAVAIALSRRMRRSSSI